MFLATLRSPAGPVIGIGLRPTDLDSLLAGKPASFALREAAIDGPDADERVLLHFATPIQLEQIRHGYFVGLSDARILLFIDRPRADQLRSGTPIDIRISGAPVNRFVVFLGHAPSDAERAFQQVGVLNRQPPPRPDGERRALTEPLYRQHRSPMMGPNFPGNFSL